MNVFQDRLNDRVDAATSLLTTLHETTLAIARASPSSPPPPQSSIDALATARDSAKLIKAHSTRLSLLIINEPFTSLVIESVLDSLITQPAPALLGAAQACVAERYTSAVRNELVWKCSRVLKELVVLVRKIPRNDRALPPDQRQGLGGLDQQGKTRTGSITATGVLWQTCDEVIQLAERGVVGVLERKVGEWRAMARDVMEELKEWSEEDEDEGYADGNGDDDDGDDDDASAQDMADMLMTSAKVIPRHDPDNLRPLLARTVKNIRLSTHLCQAIIKRRLASLPATLSGSMTLRIDKGMRALESISRLCEDLAGAFYELDAGEVARLTGVWEKEAADATRLWEKPWDGGTDRFIGWAERFREEIATGTE